MEGLWLYEVARDRIREAEVNGARARTVRTARRGRGRPTTPWGLGSLLFWHPRG